MPNHPSRCTRAALVALLVGGLTVRAADPAPGIAVHGGVADPAAKAVYLSDPAAGVVAVDIDTGKLLWESKEATHPVAARGKRVYALAPVKGRANAFRVVTLDAGDKGKAVGLSDPITLPDGLDVGDANNRLLGPKTFYAVADLDGGVLRVRWKANSFPAGKNGFGEARVDLGTGKVTTAPGERVEFPEPKHSEEVLRVIRKRNWGVYGAAPVAGGRVFGVWGGEKKGVWVLSVEVADLKTGESLWTRVYQEVRPASEK